MLCPLSCSLVLPHVRVSGGLSINNSGLSFSGRGVAQAGRGVRAS